MAGDTLVVTSGGLNLRELPDASAASLATLPKGHAVRTLDDKLWHDTWRRVETDFNARRFHGYVSASHVAPPPTHAIDPDALARQMQEGLKIYGRKTVQLVLTNQRKALIARVAPVLAHKLPPAGVSTVARLAHFFGQVALESGYFSTLVELASGSAYEGRRDLGNTEPGDGPRFKGRGLMQLTGRSNYTRASAAMGLGDALVRNPERVAEPELAVDTALWYWTSNNVNQVVDTWPGNLEAVSLAVTRAVNLGNPSSTRTPHHAKERRILTESGLEAFAPLLS